jgi:uncharacterized C2H2 Zn-finger protein
MTGPLKEVKPSGILLTGEEAEFKWLDLSLDDGKKPLKFKCGTNEELYMSGLVDADGKLYYRCHHCNAVWNREAYPKIKFHPFEHLQCPACQKIVAQDYPNKENQL